MTRSVLTTLTLLGLWTAVITSLTSQPATGSLIYVAPSSRDIAAKCSGEEAATCLTMEDIWGGQGSPRENGSAAAAGGWVPESNSKLVFLQGQHVANFSRLIIFQDVNNITLTAEGSADSSLEPTAEILCTKPAGFLFLNITRLTISRLVFTNCGRNSVNDDIIRKVFHVYVNSFFLFDPLESMSLTIASVTDLTMSGVTVQNGTGYGLIALNLFGRSIIEGSKFMFNNYHSHSLPLCNGEYDTPDRFYTCVGTNIALAFVDPLECIDEDDRPVHFLNVTSTLIAYGVNLTPYGLGSGILVAMSQTAYGMHVYIDNVTSVNNTAHNGANMAFLVYKVVDDSSISVRNSFSGYSNPLFRPSVLMILTLSGTQQVGGGLLFSYGRNLPTRFQPSCRPKSRHSQADLLSVIDTQFVGNNAVLGGAMNILFLNMDNDYGTVARISVENCLFKDNIGSPGSALYINQIRPLRNVLLARFVLKNCSFENNRYPVSAIPNSVQEFELDLLNAVQLKSVQDVSIVDCRFVDNLGTAIYSYGSVLRLSGDVDFIRNNGVNGGGLSLHSSSVVLLTPNTTVSFIDNLAQFRGGGVFVSGDNYRSPSLCFWQFELMDLHNETGISLDIELPILGRNASIVNIAEQLNIRVLFRGNEASVAGSAVYGGVIDFCTFIATYDLRDYQNSTLMFDQTFTFLDSEGDASVISSDPSSICICDETAPTCDSANPAVTLFPGQTYSIYVVAMGQRNSVSPGIVFGRFLNHLDSNDAPAVLPFESAQMVGHNCTKLSYTILSTWLDVELRLLLTLENANVRRQPTIVSIQLLPCPPGFYLSRDPPSCQCHPFLDQLRVDCNITTETVHRVSPLWLSKDVNDPDTLLAYNYCPLDYCVPDDIDYNLSQSNALCAFNRAGIICGGCQPGYSLTLGTNECEMCTDSYLALLLPFAVAGMLLVSLLLLLNSLTVSVGAINGLVFYANIIQVNKGIFFPPGHTNLMTTFIAWLNLDFGIKTCFYDGMDAYAKTLLQFAFPVYIWTIIGVVILFGHYCTSVAKLLGDKSVPVLATVFLLSVAKLQRTIIIGLSYSTVVDSNGTSIVVWMVDGNLEYLRGKHIYLFVLSLAVLVLIMLPFIFSLLFVTCLQALSSHRLFHMVNRSKPLIDAYVGPYKDNRRFWTGFLLFARGAMLIIFSQVDSNVSLLVIVVSMQLFSFFTWVGGGVYKKWPINALEFSFFANLGILAAATLFVQFSGGYKEGAIYTSITVAFLEFIGIVVFAIYQQLASFFNWNTNPKCTRKKFLNMIPLVKKFSSQNEDLDNVSSSEKMSQSTELEVVVSRGDANTLEGTLSVELREPLLDSGNYTV